MDQIKEAFDKVKSDISSLSFELKDLKKEISEIQNSILFLIQNQEKLTKNQEEFRKTQDNQTSTLRHITSTHIRQIKTNNQTSTHNSTHNLPFQSLKPLNFNSSIRNQGVSTDRQTNQQTDNSTHFYPKIKENQENKQFEQSQESFSIQPQSYQINQVQQPQSFKPNQVQQPQSFKSNQLIKNQESEDPYLVLEQLDSIKKDLRFKIKRLTNQEMLVLSTIYQFEDQGKQIDYSTLSQTLNLSESSIRDYITRIIVKKIPIVKEKVNNKRIILHISPNLKKLASLNTLLSLREL